MTPSLMSPPEFENREREEEKWTGDRLEPHRKMGRRFAFIMSLLGPTTTVKLSSLPESGNCLTILFSATDTTHL